MTRGIAALNPGLNKEYSPPGNTEMSFYTPMRVHNATRTCATLYRVGMGLGRTH